MADVLIIGYGNILRGDDALGWLVADSLRKQDRPGVEVIASHQLTPEMSELVAGVNRVIFVDAREDIPPGQILVERLDPKVSSDASFSHQCDPWGLLQNARVLFGGTPTALLVGVGGEAFELSERMTQQLDQALTKVLKLVDELISDANHPHWHQNGHKGETDNA